MNPWQPAQRKSGAWQMAALLAVVVLGGCAGGPQHQRPVLSLPQHYPAQGQFAQGAQVQLAEEKAAVSGTVGAKYIAGCRNDACNGEAG